MKNKNTYRNGSSEPNDANKRKGIQDYQNENKKEREIYKRRKLRSHLAECGKNRTNS
jgi:hypothetical protein